MWVFKAITALYLSASFAAQGSEEALPVPRVHSQSEWSDFFPGEQVKLRCEINGEDWTVIWLKDGQQIQSTDTAAIFSEKSLTVKAEAQTQSGQYNCKGIHKTNASLNTQESDPLPITVHGEKLTPVLGVTEGSQAIYFGESVTFKCSIDKTLSFLIYVWYLNDNLLSKSGNVYTVQSAKDNNNGNYRCMVQREGVSLSTDSNSINIKVSDVPRPSVTLVSPWSDAVEKEQVLLRCETVGPDWSVTWFRDGEQVTGSPNIKFSDVGGKQLEMSLVPKSFQGLYTCSTRHNAKGVRSGQSQPLKITIHDTPTPTLTKSPPQHRMYVGETVNFTCAVDISLDWTYKWYKDDVEISAGPTLSVRLGLSDGGKYSCKALRVNGAETHNSHVKTQDVDDVPVPSVKLLSTWPDVFVREKVILGCEASSTDWSFSWFKDGQPLTVDSSITITEQGANLQIQPALRSHMGAYSCKSDHKIRAVHSAPSQSLDVKVYESIPTPTLSQDPKYNWMYVGEKVHLTCNVDVGSGWDFLWFKDDSRTSTTASSITIHLGLSDEGKYWCKGTRGGQTTSDSSDKISLTVLEIPVPQLKHLTPWQDVFPSETVKLGCGASSTPSDWTYDWYKDGQTIPQDSNVASSDSDRATLTIDAAATSHGGRYTCRAKLKSRQIASNVSSELTLGVYGQKPRPILIQDPDYSILFPQEPLSLTCHINISSGWEFVWYRNGEDIKFNKDKYVVPSPNKTHSGAYTCETRRGNTDTFKSVLSREINVEIRDAPQPVLSQAPDVDPVYVGEQLSLKCSLDVSIDWEYDWYKDKQIISRNVSSIQVNATHPQTESYSCEAKRRKTLFKTKSPTKAITFSAIPTPSVKNMTEWLDVFPGETVLLSCGMEAGASDWLYTWKKDGQPISSGENVKSSPDGTTLTIISSVSHTGEYSCKAQHRKRKVFSNFSSEIRVEVYDAKPNVRLVQDPDEHIFHTEDFIFFNCEVNESSGWEYSWYRDNTLLGSGPNFTISGLFSVHSGEYKCRAKRGQGAWVFHTDHSRTVTVHVRERPSASVLLLTGWSEVFSTDSLVLKCEAEGAEDWEFKWFKGGEEIAEHLSEKHIITPDNDPDQSDHMCQGVRAGRPSFTKRSEPLKTKNLLLKRRVLLSISGCLVFGICAVFIGCIILRVFRKPVVDQERPEEADLFLTMAELEKHAPNPLAEYITDEDIKDIAKESTETDENGTTCSESTPLPLASKEEEAAPSQSNSASGNGEMVSFKQ